MPADSSATLVGRVHEEPVVPGLVKRLKDADPTARARAAEELGQVGPEGQDAILPLTVALEGSSFLTVRWFFSQAR
jgi:hypothetical protein